MIRAIVLPSVLPTDWLRLRRPLSCVVVGTALLAAGPLVVSTYWERVLVFVFVNMTLANAWNVIGGYAGYPSFGHGLFFGVGAYTAAMVIVRGGYGLVAAMVLGGLVSAVFALLFFPIFRLRGFYFALCTLAALLAVETIFKKWWFTRGVKEWDIGWSFPELGSLHLYYWLMVGILSASTLATVGLAGSKLGYALRAINKDEVVAASVGIACARYKTIAFVISAFWPGVVGAAYAPFITFISTESMFDLSITVNMIVMTVFGGAGTLFGPLIGGLFLSVVDQLVWSRFLFFHRLVFASLVVVIVSFWPRGVFQVVEEWLQRSPGQRREQSR